MLAVRSVVQMADQMAASRAVLTVARKACWRADHLVPMTVAVTDESSVDSKVGSTVDATVDCWAEPWVVLTAEK